MNYILQFIAASLLAFSLTGFAEDDHHDHDHDDHGDTHAHEEHSEHNHEAHDEDEHEEHEHHETESRDHDAHDEHQHHGESESGHHDHHGHGEELQTTISSDIAEEVGIETSKAQSETLNLRVLTYGSLVTSPEQLSHVKARFPGLIKEVSAKIGQQVSKGDLLAKIESNDSLRNYKLLAPINGIVIERHANTGEYTGEQGLFTIANFESLWAELRVYPQQSTRIEKGQSVELLINEQSVTSIIEHIVPVIDEPYQLARVKLDNSQHHLSPGMLIEGYISIDQFSVPLAVENRAIQELEGKKGIFVLDGEDYEFKALELGRSDALHTEVLNGLSDNDVYVTENSYLVKADIEKSQAEHVH